MTIQELETQVLTLNAVDKAKLISILTQNLTNGSLGIKKTPGVCGGDACVGKKEHTSLGTGGLSPSRMQRCGTF